MSNSSFVLREVIQKCQGNKVSPEFPRAFPAKRGPTWSQEFFFSPFFLKNTRICCLTLESDQSGQPLAAQLRCLATVPFTLSPDESVRFAALLNEYNRLPSRCWVLDVFNDEKSSMEPRWHLMALNSWISLVGLARSNVISAMCIWLEIVGEDFTRVMKSENLIEFLSSQSTIYIEEEDPWNRYINALEQYLIDSKIARAEDIKKFKGKEAWIKSRLTVPSVNALMTGTLHISRMQGSQVKTVLKMKSSKADWKTSIQGHLPWKNFLSLQPNFLIDFGFFTADVEHMRLVFTTQSVVDLSSDEFSPFIHSFFENSFESIRAYLNIARIRYPTDIEESHMTVESELISEERPPIKKSMLSTRDPGIILLAKREDMFQPPPSAADCFFTLHENTEELLTVDLCGWHKFYRKDPLDLDSIREFYMSLYRSNIRFERFPLNCTYVHDSGTIRLLPKFPSGFLNPSLDMSDIDYRFKFLTSWLEFVERKISPRSLNQNEGVLKGLDVKFFEPRNFKFPDLDSIEHLIGKGGFGFVYLNKLGDEPVAVKGVNPARPYSHEMVIEELKLMMKLTHPGIVKLYGCTMFQGKIMIVMERCDFSLSTYLKRFEGLDDPLKLSDKLKVLKKVAEALEFMHCKIDICHFDLKPVNILIKDLSQILKPKLTDFGMSSRRKIDGSWSKPGYTLGYSSPEQLQGYKAGKHSDIWAFAMVAYFLIFRKAPYDYLKQVPNDKNDKKRFYTEELCMKKRKPLLDATWCQENPKLAYLLRQCWHSNPTSRPKISFIVRKLNELIEVYKTFESSVPSQM